MAGHTPLPLDATLSSIVSRLGNAVGFVQGALNAMGDYNRSDRPVVLRIGVSPRSKGKRPSYCIDIECTDESGPDNRLAVMDDDNHEPWVGAKSNLKGHWSTKCMTYAEVKDLLSKLESQQHP